MEARESLSGPATGAPECCLRDFPQCEHWKRFDFQMVIARCRGLLTTEARGLTTKMIADGAFSAQVLRDQICLAIANARPKSRLIPLGLGDAAVEKIVDAVVRDVAETWTT